MDYATIRRLNRINRDFYRITAADFDQTRGQPWPGWVRLLPYFAQDVQLNTPTDTARRVPTRVLDVGCGNGRFGLFLAEAARTRPVASLQRIEYHGMDSNAALLERARLNLSALPQVTLEARDILEEPPDAGDYDLVVLFGVLHHVAGYEQRLQLMRLLGQRVAPGGLLAFACWRFYEYERFRRRIVPWPEDIQVERHDYLLDWRQGQAALRYCHYADDDEHAALVAATGLCELETYRADGETGDANRYSILQTLTSLTA